MPTFGRIPAWIYVHLVSDDPADALTELTALAATLDTLEITDADVSLFEVSDGRVRPDWRRAPEVWNGRTSVPLSTPDETRRYEVVLRATQGPGLLQDGDHALLLQSGLLGTHRLTVDAANLLEASLRATSTFETEWLAYAPLFPHMLIDTEQITHVDTVDATSTTDRAPEIALVRPRHVDREGLVARRPPPRPAHSAPADLRRETDEAESRDGRPPHGLHLVPRDQAH